MLKRSLDDLGRISVPDFKSGQKFPVTIVLDNVRSLHNVGSAFRTSDAFRVERILLTGITGTPPHREIEKSALGATQSVDWVYVEDVAEAVRQLKNENYQVAIVEQASPSVPLQEFVWPVNQKLALVFGNEVNGISDSILDLADLAVEIPQFGTKHSFNISVCLGIVLWEVFRKSGAV